MTKVKSNITPDTILKNFWKDNNRFADLFNACFFDGNPELNPDDLTAVSYTHLDVYKRQDIQNITKLTNFNFFIVPPFLLQEFS